MRVITNASSVKGQGRFSQLQRIRSRHPDIDGSCLHVKAVLRDSSRVSPQEFIASRRAIATNDFDFSAWSANRIGQVPKDVIELCIILLHFSGAMVSQELIQSCGCFGNISIALPKNDVNPFTGVRVVEA
jgi:hypothetical protein